MKKMRMMIVDDEERFLSTMKKLLAKKGYDVVLVPVDKKGPPLRPALEIMSVQNIHVVILDVKMPSMDGNETLREIKKRFPLSEVIMLTGHATMESAVEGLKSGAIDYLMKPADLDDIIKKAEDAFEKIQGLEEKIRVARMRKIMKSPSEIIQDS